MESYSKSSKAYLRLIKYIHFKDNSNIKETIDNKAYIVLTKG
jgi:hypothetical protein